MAKGTKEKRPGPIVVALEMEDPRQEGGQWKVLVTAIVTQDMQALVGQNMQFYCGAKDVGAPAQTDGSGRALCDITLSVPVGVKIVSIEAQVVGQVSRARKIIMMPEEKPAPRKGRPVEFFVTPRRVGNRITFFIQVLDEEGKGVDGCKITIIDGNQEITEYADEDGEKVYAVNLQPREEKELIFSTAGYGHLTVSRTFRGR